MAGLASPGQAAVGVAGVETYSRARVTSATTGTRWADGARETVESIFASSTSGSRGALQNRGASWRKPTRNPKTIQLWERIPSREYQ